MTINEHKIDRIVKQKLNCLLEEYGKMSAHKHSMQTIYDLRFHDSIYMPGGLKEQCYSLYNSNKGSFVLSAKGKSKIGCDDAHNYDEHRQYLYIIKKFVVRVPYDSSHSVSIVFGIGKRPLIITAWLNRLDDNHTSLNPNLYVKSKKERQERIKSIVDRTKNNKQKNQ